MFRCEFVPEGPEPLSDAALIGAAPEHAAVLKERLRRLQDMQQAHGDRGALVVLAALWVEAQHTARRFPAERIPVTSYRVRGA